MEYVVAVGIMVCGGGKNTIGKMFCSCGTYPNRETNWIGRIHGCGVSLELRALAYYISEKCFGIDAMRGVVRARIDTTRLLQVRA